MKTLTQRTLPLNREVRRGRIKQEDKAKIIRMLAELIKQAGRNQMNQEEKQ